MFLDLIILRYNAKENLILSRNEGRAPLTRNKHEFGKGISCKEKFCKENFQNGFMVAGGGFLSYLNHQLINFKEEKRIGL